MILKHFPTRNILCESVDEKFLIENGLDRDLQIPDELIISMPAKFSIKESMSDVRDQGGAGTCASFAVLSNLEYKHGRRDLSEACITHETEKRYGDCKEGLATWHVYLVGRDNGTVDELHWRYDDNKICWNPAPNMNGKPRFKFSKVERVFYRSSKSVIENMIKELNDGEFEMLLQPQNFVKFTKGALSTYKKPVTISVPVWFKWDGYFDAGWESGVIKMPSPVNLQTWLEKNGIETNMVVTISEDPKSTPNISGWHAISICGYDDSTGRFTFKNSWGKSWGNDGYGTIPYIYITRYGRDGIIGI